MPPKKQTEETALATQAPAGALTLGTEVPDWMREDESALALNTDFDQSELRVPQLKICQAMTPERLRTNPNHIPGLQDGDLFNASSGKSYGPGPIPFVMLKFWVNFIKFGTKEEGNEGQILCRGDASGGCELNNGGMCPNSEFKGSVKPTCTRFMNYLLYLPETKEIAWFSAKSTAIGTMRQFNSSLRAIAGVPDFAKVFTLASGAKPSPGQAGSEFYVPVIPKRPIGIVSDQQVYADLKKLAKDLADKTVDTSAAEGDDEGGEASGEKVPF